MKRLLSCAIAFLGLLGCYGKSAPERSPDWEADLPATARAPSLPMLVLGAAQAYATGSAADFSLFNLAESWGGIRSRHA